MGFQHTAKVGPGLGMARPATQFYPWLVFALTFGLLLSDYMSRQVLNAAFPLLKAEWALSDTQLGSLSGIVGVMVGILTLPLSYIADRLGRVRGIVIMAGLWSLATLGCGLANSYNEMFLARCLLGIGEAAYGSVGIALVLSIFPRHLQATISSSFMAGGAFGSVLGISFGGMIAAKYGWRVSFSAMAAFGFLLVILYACLVKGKRIARYATHPVSEKMEQKAHWRTLWRDLFPHKASSLIYIGSGLQLFLMSSMIAWLPSYFNRYAGMPTAKAAVTSGLLVLVGALGMILCGIVTDRVSDSAPRKKLKMAIFFCAASFILLSIGMQLPPGKVQMLFFGATMLVIAGTTGPVGALVAHVVRPAVHGTAFATLTLINNVLGLAAGPIVVGMLADSFGLKAALQIAPFVALVAACIFLVTERFYAANNDFRATP